MNTAKSCCCSIFNKKEETKGSGILATFTSNLLREPLTPDALQGLLPGVKKAVKRAGKLESKLSTWAIFTCHSVIPGCKYLSDGELHFNGKQHKLQDIVSGCVSCCSEDSLLGPGEDVLRSPHTRSKKCTIGLDFTILFLKEQAIEEVVGHLQQPVTIPCDRKPCDWYQRILPILSDCEQTTPDAPRRLALYSATDTGLIQEHPISNCETCQPVPANQDSLENGIDKYVSMKQLKYEVDTQGVATPEESLLPGAAIIHINNQNTSELVGFHVRDGVGNTIYGIIHLLQGGPAPVLGVFKHPYIRRLWATWWRYMYLLIPNEITLERMDLKHLLELLHKLLEKSNNVQRIAQLDMLYPPKARIATLNLLSDIFNQFGVRRIDDATLTRCLKGECATFAEDLKTCVRKLLKFLVEVMGHLLKEIYFDSHQINNGVIEACFRCLAKMMNFECDDIMREGLKKPIEDGLFEKLYRACYEVERERTDRCHECNAVWKPSNVQTYFLEMLMKYNTRQLGRYCRRPVHEVDLDIRDKHDEPYIKPSFPGEGHTLGRKSDAPSDPDSVLTTAAQCNQQHVDPNQTLPDTDLCNPLITIPKTEKDNLLATGSTTENVESRTIKGSVLTDATPEWDDPAVVRTIAALNLELSMLKISNLNSNKRAANTSNSTATQPIETQSRTHPKLLDLRGNVQQKRFNIVIYGITENKKRMNRSQQQLNDHQKSSEVIHSIAPEVPDTSIRDCRRLGRYNETKSRPILVTLSETSHVQLILANRSKLSNFPGICIKPYMTCKQRNSEGLLLMKRWELMQNGLDKTRIKIKRCKSLFVDYTKHGTVSNYIYEEITPESSEAEVIEDPTSTSADQSM